MCDYKLEESAMAVVVCNGMILTTNENIYGVERISLPKGHVEENETSLDAAIRECLEETNIVLKKSNLVRKLTPFTYEFINHSNEKIRKTLTPYLFYVNSFGNAVAGEERILWVRWMNVEEFLSLCPYENVKNVVNEYLSMK